MGFFPKLVSMFPLYQHILRTFMLCTNAYASTGAIKGDLTNMVIQLLALHKHLVNSLLIERKFSAYIPTCYNSGLD